MSNPVDNPGFIGDGGVSSHSFEPRGEKDTQTVDSNLNKHNEKMTADYDPYHHRDVKHPTTNLETFLHLLKGSVGTGILSMPLAFYHSGYVLGLICTLIIGAICTYGISILVKSEYELCKRKKVPSLNYPATAEAAFHEGPPFLQKCAPYAGHTVNTFLIIYQLGVCCAYTVFIAENIQDVADQYIDSLGLAAWMSIILLPLILINYIRNLKLLAPFSTAANLITISSFGIVLYYLITVGITFEERNAVGEIADFPLYFGTVLFALEAVGVIMPLENEMKTPNGFFGVLYGGMTCVISLYVGMGLLGYLSYGPDVEDTITLNLAPDEVVAQVAKILLAVAIFISHPLQMYAAVDIIWNEYLSKKIEKSRYKLIFEYILRTCLVVLTYALAVAIPKLGLFISLFGAFCLSMLGLAFPAVIETSTFWYTLTGVRGKLIITKNVCIALFGLIGLVVGTYTSLEKIVEYFQDG